jgi:hypothetical protein
MRSVVKRSSRSGISRAVLATVTAVSILAGGPGAAHASSRAAVPSAKGATDPSADAVAKAALVDAADLGTGWTQYRGASGAFKSSAKSCNLKFGSPLKVSDRGFAGPMYKDPTGTFYLYSYAYAFRSAAGATAYTKARNSPAFLKCKVTDDDAAQRKRDPKSFVRLDQSTSPSVGGPTGMEGFYSETEGTKSSDGTESPQAEYYRSTFRHGRVVYLLFLDTGLASDQAGSAELGNRLSAAAEGAQQAIDRRLTALGE